MLLPILLFAFIFIFIFSGNSCGSLPPDCLTHFSGGQTISTFQGTNENVSKDVCTAVKTGAAAGLSSGKCGRPT